MSRSLPGPESIEAGGEPQSRAGSTAEAGRVPGRFWEARYDGVIAAWVSRELAQRETVHESSGDPDAE